MARTVVPWVTPSSFSAGAVGTNPDRRNSSAKFGPGSSSGGKKGNAIRPRRLAAEVGNGCREEVGIFAELADPGVAVEAEQAAHLAGVVVVVDVEGDVWPRFAAADGAAARLGGEHLLVLLDRQAELPLQM